MAVLETTISLKVTVEYYYSKNSRSAFDKTFGNWLPGEGPDIKLLSIMMDRGPEKMDIKDLLDAKTIEFIENEINEIEESGGD